MNRSNHQSSNAPIPLIPLPVRADTARPPVPLSSLVGRQCELADVRALLRDPGVRLITLAGPGGIGKTRLALAVAAVITADFRDGVAFVDLSAIRDPEQVTPAIAQALGIRHGSDRPALAALTLSFSRRAFAL